jgi:hypothetical protein
MTVPYTFATATTTLPLSQLDANFSAVGQSANVTYTSSLANAVSRTSQSKMSDIVSVKDFGAVGDGTTNDTAAMQAAHNTGKIIYYPAGTYKFSSISMSAGGIVGAGCPDTILAPYGSTTSDAITFTSTTNFNIGPTFKNFEIQPSVSKTAGNMITITATGSGNSAITEISGLVVFQNIYNGISINIDQFWIIQDCFFGNCKNACVIINNTPEPDYGGGTITNCSFFNGGTGGSPIGILHYQGGGQVINNCRFSGLSYHYRLEFTGTTNDMADILISNNYFGLYTVAGIYLTRTTGTRSVSGIQISGNKFETLTSNVYGIYAPTVGSNWVNGLYIQSNVFWPGTNGFGIAANNINSINILSNAFLGGQYGYYIDSACVKGSVIGNHFVDQTVNVGAVLTSTVYYETFVGQQQIINGLSAPNGTGRLQVIGKSGSYVGASFYMDNNGNDDWMEFTQPSGVGGRISKVAGTFTLTTVSDQRVKSNITDAPSSLEKLNSLKVREFLMDGQESRTVGLVAQEVLTTMPEIVQTPKDLEKEYYTVAYSNLVPHLLKAVQELTDKLNSFESKVGA